MDAVRNGVPPRSDGHSGLRVVRVLEELQRSLEESRVLRPSERAPGLLLGEDVSLPDDGRTSAATR